MTKRVTINIPVPCHERWETFRQTKAGGYCQACSQEVIDFTTWSDDAVRNYFMQSPGNTCGRFRSSQLKTYWPDKPTGRSTAWAAVISGVIILFSGRTMAQSQRPPKEVPVAEPSWQWKSPSVSHVSGDSVIIRGVVKDAQDQAGMPDVNILRSGTPDGTVSDTSGRFELVIPDRRQQEKILISFIGYVTQELEVPVGVNMFPVEVNLSPDTTCLESVVVGGAVAVRRISPRRWWWGFKNLFRR